MVKKQIVGTEDRPRLVVSRSLNNLYAQVINDQKGMTVVGMSSLALKQGRGNVALAMKLGEAVAEKAMKLGIKKVVFDRAGRVYCGRIKAVAEGARKKGLQF